MGRASESKSGPEADGPSFPQAGEGIDYTALLEPGQIVDDLYRLDRLAHQILSLLMDAPGASTSELTDMLPESFAKTQSVLTKLQDAGIIETVVEDQVQKFYPIAVPEPTAKSWLRRIDKNQDFSTVVDYLVLTPQKKQTVNKVVSSVQTTHGCVIQLLKDLERQGLVKVIQESGRMYVETLPDLIQYWSQIRGPDEQSK